MRRGFAILFGVVFILTFVAACNDTTQTSPPPPPPATTEETTTAPPPPTTTTEETTTAPLPKSGGPAIGGLPVLLPTVALLLGSGVLVFAVLRRR